MKNIFLADPIDIVRYVLKLDGLRNERLGWERGPWHQTRIFLEFTTMIGATIYNNSGQFQGIVMAAQSFQIPTVNA